MIIIITIYVLMLIFHIIPFIQDFHRENVLYHILSLSVSGVFLLASLIFRRNNLKQLLILLLFPLYLTFSLIFNIHIDWNFSLLFLYPVIAFIVLEKYYAAVACFVLIGVMLIPAFLFSFGVLSFDYIVTEMWIKIFVLVIMTALIMFLYWMWDRRIQTALKNLYSDSLTGLPNRQKYMDELNNIPDPFLLLLDIDSFVEVNEGFGTAVANQILIDLIKEIRDFLYPLDYKPYRLNSDDFLIVFPHQGANPNFDYMQVAKEMVRTISEIRFEGTVDGMKYDVHITITIGMTRSPEYPKASLLSRANTALKNAKLNSLPALIFTEDQDKEKTFQSNVKWLNILTDALQEKRIIPYYQPIFDNTNGKISKYEALVRLRDPEGKIISPFFFLDIAQKSRLYPRITQTMFNYVTQLISQTGCDISINLSMRDIKNPETVLIIESSLNRHPFVARHMIFELLENYELENSPQLTIFMHNMRSKGVRFAIDDFGSGYSNFEYLMRINPDYIKISGELVKDIHQIAESRILVENITNFAHKMGFETIAEYVHNEEVWKIIKEIGVDFSQGFYLGQPEEKLLILNE